MLNLKRFIATRIYKKSENSFSKTVQNIAVITIALGLAVMLGSYMILQGFQERIKTKIYSVSGELQIRKYTFNNNYANAPIRINFDSIQSAAPLRYVGHIQGFAVKPALIKDGSDLSGILFKGVGRDFDTALLKDQLIAGNWITPDTNSFSRDVVLSEIIARQLNCWVDSTLLFYFIQDPPRYRRLRVAGIYNTEMEEIDSRMVLGDIDLVRQLNGWSGNEVGGYEVFLNNGRIGKAELEILERTDYGYRVDRASELFAALFDWLTLINKNATLVLVLVLFVASFNLISVLIILSMERTRMIGILKSLGATNSLVRGVFVQVGMQLIMKGMLLGNLLGLGFGVLQYYFRFIPLDAENYYIGYVPIFFNWPIIVGLNLLILLIITLVLLIPAAIISRTKPVVALRWS